MREGLEHAFLALWGLSCTVKGYEEYLLPPLRRPYQLCPVRLAPGPIMTSVVAYADGSALGNPGPGGYAWWVSDQCWLAAGFAGPVTNNAMELSALLSLIQAVPPSTPLLVRTDSRYSIDAVTKWSYGWRRNNWRKKDGSPVLNLDLIRPLFELVSSRPVSLEWVRGHAGHAGNEVVDTKARACATRSASTRADFTAGPGWVS